MQLILDKSANTFYLLNQFIVFKISKRPIRISNIYNIK